MFHFSYYLADFTQKKTIFQQVLILQKNTIKFSHVFDI